MCEVNYFFFDNVERIIFDSLSALAVSHWAQVPFLFLFFMFHELVFLISILVYYVKKKNLMAVLTASNACVQSKCEIHLSGNKPI